MKWKIHNERDLIPSGRRAVVAGGRGNAVFSDNFNLSFPEEESREPPAESRRPGPAEWLSPVIDRLEAFDKLQDDWDGYGAMPPRSDVVLAAIRFIRRVGAAGAATAPSVFPTRTGGVLFAWKRGDHRLEVQFVSPDAASFVCMNKSTKEVVRGALFTDSDDRTFGELLTRHFER
jgi:hypothetical protein